MSLAITVPTSQPVCARSNFSPYPEPDLPPRGGYGLRIIARHEEVRTVIQSLQTGILPDVPDVWIS